MRIRNRYPGESFNEHLYKATQNPIPFYPLNWIENKVEKKQKSIINMSDPYFINRAMRETRLSDWGTDAFFPALEVLLKSAREEARLTLFGKFCFRNKVINILKNRLNIQEELKKNPGIMKERIKKPLFIASLPRTGTTLLHNLISLDPSFRYVTGWEAMRPSLNPRFKRKKKDPRILWRKQDLKDIKRYFPDLLNIHPLAITGPEECHYLLANTFGCEITFDILFDLPHYRNWLKMQDKVPIYQYYKKVLQLLQWQNNKTFWVLKSPDHLNHLHELLEVFPDACIVTIHRDPKKVVPSFCNLTAFGRLINSKQVDFHDIGNRQMKKLSGWLSNAERSRGRNKNNHIIDINYKDLVSHPAEMVKKIYRHFGYTFNKNMEGRIYKFLRQNKPKKKKGANFYQLEQFGLSDLKINHHFDPYMKKYL